MKPKIAFFGSDQYSDIVFRALKKNPHFQTEKAPPANLPVEKIRKRLKQFKPEAGVLASYGRILTKEILFLPKHGILNIHPSLLPQYRGPTPVPTAILNGETKTGVSIIKMDEEVDHGPIVVQFEMAIYPDDTSEKLLERLFTAGAKVLITILPAYLKGQIKPRPQDHTKATFSQKLTRENGRIDWQKPADFNERFIRAMLPWPGAWTDTVIKAGVKKRLKILKAHLENNQLILDQVQVESKKPVTWKQFLEGYPKAKLI